MPVVNTIRAPPSTEEGRTSTNAEDMSLHLPSSLTPAQRTAGCIRNCAGKELLIRIGRMEDGLGELRRLRRVFVTLCAKYRLQIGGQGLKTNTQARAVLHGMSARISRCVHRYRADRLAALALDPTGDWVTRLQPLLDEDIRGPYREEGERESRRQQSWIWTVAKRGAPALDADDDECNEHMRSEWARTRARMLRWREEVLLCEEEMRRILAYLDWHAKRWRVLAARERDDISDEGVRAGLRAYAFRQAAQWRALSVKFGETWKPILDNAGLGQSWIGGFVRPEFVAAPYSNSRGPTTTLAPSTSEGSAAVAPWEREFEGEGTDADDEDDGGGDGDGADGDELNEEDEDGQVPPMEDEFAFLLEPELEAPARNGPVLAV